MPVWPKLIEPIECLMACHAETVDGKPPNAKWPNSSIQRGLPIDAKATIKAQLSSPSRALAAIFRTLAAVVSTSMKASRMEASLVGGTVRIFLKVSQSASRETLCQEPNPWPPSMSAPIHESRLRTNMPLSLRTLQRSSLWEISERLVQTALNAPMIPVQTQPVSRIQDYSVSDLHFYYLSLELLPGGGGTFTAPVPLPRSTPMNHKKAMPAMTAARGVFNLARIKVASCFTWR